VGLDGLPVASTGDGMEVRIFELLTNVFHASTALHMLHDSLSVYVYLCVYI
jgi:hypothetical protein